MEKNNHLKAVLLDLDGTLVDSLPEIYHIYCKFLAKYGHMGSKEEFDSLNGPSLKEVIEKLKHTYKIPDPLEDLIEYYTFKTMEVYQDLPLFPGVRDFLSFSKENGLLLAVVTAAPRMAAEFFLTRHKVDHFFVTLISGDEVEKAKPDPAIYQKVLKRLNLLPANAVAIEDSSKGVLSSLGAGISTIWISHGKEVKDLPKNRVNTICNWGEARSYFEKILL